MNNNYKILLYYKYVHIESPIAFRDEQRALCDRLNMKGRIIVAHEGLNGTIEGTEEACEEYMSLMKADTRFTDIHWKISSGTSDGTAFPRLSVKARKEIVSLHLADDDTDIDPNQVTGV